MTRGVVAGAAGMVALGGAVVGFGLAGGGDPTGAEAEAGTSPAARLGVGKVERRTLVDQQTVSGTLGYDGERTVLARLSGTVSWLPAVGAVVKPGRPIAKIDGSPVLLLDGTVPAYRALQAGVADGDDIRQLERGLSILGYDPGTVDATWSASTTAAVNAWRDDLGLEQTGVVELGRVVFLPGARRIKSREVEIGAVSGSGGTGGGSDSGDDAGADGGGGAGGGSATTVLTTTSVSRVVTLDVDAADQGLAKAGAKVSVELPDGATIPGVIAKVGRVAESSSDGDGAGGEGDGGDGGATISVTVKLTGGKGGRLDQAPVNVELARETRKGVLTVPVTALVAQRGGGYAVDVIHGGRRRLVTVEPGLFADGLVEVEGDGLRDGTRITVPAA